ncbi:class I SAM-dependent methyltransferase [Candidatus Daviesbacteria bacterium]|nr:class I SAM-dependent methyltransferase [Candidatus Daviesbacteria bacterium]
MNRRKETFIGSRDPDYNSTQYNLHAELYKKHNPLGLRGGHTPALRVLIFEELIAPPGTKKVFEIGPGPGFDALELHKEYEYRAGDISHPFIEDLRRKGLQAGYFDASKDSIPEGIEAIYAHISLIHIRPDAFTRLLADCRDRLQGPRAFFASFLDGFGHERSKRNEEFSRDFTYYPRKRLEQITYQEGLDIKIFDLVEAFNGTKFWHVGGVFKQEYKGGSYGKDRLHPFGDVFWTPGSLYKGENLMCDLMKNQVKTGLLEPEVIDTIKRYESLIDRRIIDPNDAGKLAEAINTIWAAGLKDQNIEAVIQHAKDYFARKPRFKSLTETAFAVCNNNGFNNILAGIEPSWLIQVLKNHLNIDSVTSAQWETEGGTQFTGKLTGDVFYSKNNPNPGRPITNYEDRLRNLLGTKYKRITIGVGHSYIDDALIGVTDYPIYAYPDKQTSDTAHKKDIFRSGDGHPIHSAPSEYWLRWAVIDNERKLIKYLNMLTSDRFPIAPNPEFNGYYWMCPDNRLNLDFYKANQDSVRIL